ncbi:MAG: hypothetical protein U1A27_06100 [Phycisphaerae bacterium]
MGEIFRAAVRPFGSRKFRVALATVIASFLAEYGLNVREELVYTILGVGSALILGIAHEDAGKAAAEAAAGAAGNAASPTG